jgi:hypothetical protein
VIRWSVDKRKAAFGMRIHKQWAIGFIDASEKSNAFATIFSDLVTHGVWHIGLFIVSAPR